MMHRVYKRLIGAYAEGRLRWPLTRIVEKHTGHCRPCRVELQRQCSFWRRIDNVLFSPAEVAQTAALAVRGTVQRPNRIHLRLPATALAAVAIVIALAFVPGRWHHWLGPATRTAAAASSWGEGVATSVSWNHGGLQRSEGAQSHSSGTGLSTGLPAKEGVVNEWGG